MSLAETTAEPLLRRLKKFHGVNEKLSRHAHAHVDVETIKRLHLTQGFDPHQP